MPKKVDHHARRTLIADALMRVAADRGLEAVSLRHVAAEAGVSSGMVQHYFRTKDEMMTFALGVVGERIRARIERGLAALGEASSIRAQVRALLLQLLPLDKTRWAEGRVALAFLAYAAGRPSVAAKPAEDAALMREFVAERIRTARAAGAPGGAEPSQAATALLALVDGLGLQILSEHCPPDLAVSVFEDRLDALFGRE
ncbi:TetR/AcrR family transcriptional regulator [Streptomyces pathocidini]|uniref:TetR/AcrR family transcriptional regulator n=1 Tax=Streptomyces pathocidini TaxID=1650571 RepID=A0ABW7URL2_9ACTN|nr:TetR/AcrR family transcriptional regulator [Streptomyces pathocidini]